MKVIVLHATDIIKGKRTNVNKACSDYISNVLGLTNPLIIFLAGGASTDWRVDVEKQIVKGLQRVTSKIYDGVLVCDPKTDGIGKTIKYSQLIEWESFFLENADMLAFNFEGSQTDQPFSLFELGRYGASFISDMAKNYTKFRSELDTCERVKRKMNLTGYRLSVNVNPLYRQKFGMMKQLKLMAGETMLKDDCYKWIWSKITFTEYMEPHLFGGTLTARAKYILKNTSVEW